MTLDRDRHFEQLLNYLNHSRGLDFTGYKRNSLQRLTTKRMQHLGVQNFSEYLDYLQVHPNEHNSLFNSLMLNVTAFFRDRSAWDFLREKIIPHIIKRKETKPIRLWSAGCASGEEAYSLAILFAEALGIEKFCQRVKIYATDLDEEAVTRGRQALYTAKDIEPITLQWREKYFESKGSDYVFCHDLRRCVIFGRHDLVHDAPISRLDLLCCRNTLMYFNAETQAKVLGRFHFALQDYGYLFAGKAEMLLAQSGLFTSVNNKHRVFTKASTVNWRDHLAFTSENSDRVNKTLTVSSKLSQEAFDTSPIAQIVLKEFKVVLINHQARSWLGLSIDDIDKPFSELELSRQIPRLQLSIERAYKQLCCREINNIELEIVENKRGFFNIQINPLIEDETKVLGVNISLINISSYRDLRQRLHQYSQEIEAVQEELQTTNEELETTNEELQSTNEELETTNEELQSTNEELETMNKELQASNEELQTTNNELNVRTEQLNRISIFMESVLISLKMGMTVLDNRLSIQLWNNRMNEIWGLRPEEARDRFFFDLDIGLPLQPLRKMILICQTQETDYQEITLQAVNRRGKTINCRVICTPLEIEEWRQGVILLMEVKEK